MNAADGQRIAYRVVGNGEITVVLAHCWGCTSALWDDTAARLGQRYRFVLVDLPGHGQSTSTRRAWTVEAYARDLAAVAASGGEYGQGLVWRWATHSDKPGENPDAAFGIPSDTFWMSGHDGQNVAIIKSRQLVIVRLGLTPYAAGYAPQPLVKAVLEATQSASPGG